MIIDSLRRIFALIKKEFITIIKDPKSRGIIIMLPLMQLLIFANAVTMEVKNIDMAVIDRDNTYQSRELISRFEHSPRFRNIICIEDENEFKNLVDNQKVQLGLYINNDFSKKIKAQKPTEVLVVGDGRQTNSSGIASGYASQIISSYSDQVVKKQGATINAQTRNWYNPNLDYQWFVLTILIATLSVVVTLILTALSIAREREVGTFDQLIVSPLSSFEILLGKTIPPMVISMVLTCVMITIIITCFHVPFQGSVLLLFISVFFALLALVGIGLSISSLVKTQQQAILGVVTFLMPSILLSGFISPIDDMPVFLQYLTYLNPTRFFMNLTKGIFLKGMGIEEIVINIIPLIIIAIITLSVAGWTFKRKLD